MPKKERDETEAKIKQAILDVLEGRMALVIDTLGSHMFCLYSAPVANVTAAPVARHTAPAAAPVDDDSWDDAESEDAVHDEPENPDDVVGEEDLAPDERTSDIDVVPL